MCKGRVENRPMGQCLWDIRKNSLLQRERKVWTSWGTILQKLCRSTRRVRVGPCRGTSHGQCPPALPSLTPVRPGLDTQKVRTHRTKSGSNSWCQQEEIQELLGDLCSGSEWVPPRESLQHPPGSSRSSFNSTHKTATSPRIHPSLLGISLDSFWPPLPPLPALLSSCFRDPPARQGCILHTPSLPIPVIPGNRISCGSHPWLLRHARGREERWRAEDED